jgi:hypothetical protein
MKYLLPLLLALLFLACSRPVYYHRAGEPCDSTYFDCVEME